MKRNTVLSLAVIMAGLGGSAGAAPIFDNLADANQGGLYAATGTSGPPDGPLAQSFTAGNHSLHDVKLALSALNDTGSIIITLLNDAGGTPGSLVATLGTLTDSNIFAAGGIDTVSFANMDLSSFPPVSMTSGATYWIDVADAGVPLADTTTVAWSVGTDTAAADVVGQFIFADGVSTDVPTFGGPFQMQVNDAPEPISLSLLGVGVAGLVALRRRRAKAAPTA